MENAVPEIFSYYSGMGPIRMQRILFLITVFFAFFSAHAQEDAQDSLRLKKYYKLVYPDSSALILNDTAIPADTAILKIKKRWFARFYYRYMYVGEDEGRSYAARKEPPSYEGQTAGIIHITRLEPFGTNIDDTAQILKDWLINAGNTIHVLTAKKVVKKNLLFKEGDILGAVTLAESERLLRTLDFIQDVRIYGIERAGSDTVDILVVVKDVFSIDLGLHPTDYNEVEVMVRDANMFGLGHELSNNFIISTERRPGYEGNYAVKSIFGTYMRGDVRFASTLDSLLVGGGLNRDFVSTEIRHAGGLSYHYRILKPYDKDDDERGTRIEYGGHQFDGWYGHNFPLKTRNERFAHRSSFVVSGRTIYSKFTERPSGIQDTSRSFQSSVLPLVGLSFSRSDFHKEILVLRFGVTEDIPVGRSFNITAGYEAGEVADRYYAGASISHGKHFKRAGYFFNSLDFGSYIYDRDLEDGALRFTSVYYSKLIAPRGRFKQRFFLRGTYVHGINRTYNNDRLDYSDYELLRGMETFDVSGNNALGAGAAINIYSPWNFGGFRLAFEAFSDVSYISNRDDWRIVTRPYWGMGFGLRLNNESFLFGTISGSMIFYPSPPPDTSPVGVILSINPNMPLPNFNPKKPQTVRYSRHDKVYYY